MPTGNGRIVACDPNHSIDFVAALVYHILSEIERPHFCKPKSCVVVAGKRYGAGAEGFVSL